MKIGITTFQWADNYGALIQAHALQTFLQARGHEVQIVDYRPQKGTSLARRWLSASPRGCVRKWEANWKKLLFERFRKKHLVRTPEVFRSASELRKIADRFDLLITGSDQVWNPRWLDQSAGLFDLYFLSFAGEKTKRISYAASIGHSDCSTLTPEWQQILAERMNAMDAISVREQSGVDLVKNLSGRNDATCVADPTLLLNRAHYEKLAETAASREGSLFSYMLHGLEADAQNICQQIANAKDLAVVRCDARKTAVHRGYILLSPAGWLKKIRETSFMVTNSFHGVVFCLIFHTPFAVVLINGQIGSMNARIIDLLNAVGLSDRIVSPGNSLPADLLAKEPDWNDVDQKIAAMRIGSVKFLEEQRL